MLRTLFVYTEKESFWTTHVSSSISGAPPSWQTKSVDHYSLTVTLLPVRSHSGIKTTVNIFHLDKYDTHYSLEHLAMITALSLRLLEIETVCFFTLMVATLLCCILGQPAHTVFARAEGDINLRSGVQSSKQQA